MTGTAGITPATLTEIALALEAANLDWEQGRATSPDTRDFVLITERIVAERVGPEYLWLDDGTTREQVAEALYEAQSDGQLNEWAEMAEWLATAVTTGQDLGQSPEVAPAWLVREYAADGSTRDVAASREAVANRFAAEAVGEGAVKAEVLDPQGNVVDTVLADDREPTEGGTA